VIYDAEHPTHFRHMAGRVGDHPPGARTDNSGRGRLGRSP
jgi:hypothetical protein